MTSEQIRAARALVRWEQMNLADASGVSLPTIKRIETKPGILAAHQPTVDALRRALEAAGCIFIAENGEGPGVRLQKVPAEQGTYPVSAQIEALEAKIADIPVGGEPSPETGMNTMRRAVAENDLAGLKGRRFRSKKK